MNLKNKLLTAYVILSVIGLFGLGFELRNAFQNNRAVKQEKDALQDTLHLFKTKDGKNAAFIQTIIADRKELVNVARTKDSIIGKLLKEKKVVDVTHVKTMIRIDTVARTDTERVYVQGVVVKPDSLFISKQIHNRWYDADVKLHNDSLSLAVNAYDDLVFSHKYQPTGLFKPDKLIVSVINENPISKTTGLASYEVAAPKPKPGVPFALGAIAATLVLFLLHK